MDGFEASQKILDLTHQENEPGYCRIVALTSYTSDEIRDRCLKIGLSDFINKPLHAIELQRMVHLHFYRVTEEELE